MFDTEMWFQKLDDTFFEELMDVGKLSTKMVNIEMELMKPQKMNFTKGKIRGWRRDGERRDFFLDNVMKTEHKDGWYQDGADEATKDKLHQG